MNYIKQSDFQAKWESLKTQKAKDRLSKIWSLATDGWRLTRVCPRKWKQAERLYKAVLEEHRVTEEELELGNREETYGTFSHRMTCISQKSVRQTCKYLAHELGLSIYIGTFLHVESSKNSQIM